MTATAKPAAETGSNGNGSALLPQPLLLFFSSVTNGSSRRVDGFLAQVLQRRGNHHTFQLRRIDADERPDLFARFHVDEVPTLLVLAGGRAQGRLTKPRGCRDIVELLSPWLK